MRDAVLQMMRERKGRDVYVLGAANVGKSTFIRAAMDELRSAGNYFAPSKRLPVASAMPGRRSASYLFARSKAKACSSTRPDYFYITD